MKPDIRTDIRRTLYGVVVLFLLALLGAGVVAIGVLLREYGFVRLLDRYLTRALFWEPSWEVGEKIRAELEAHPNGMELLHLFRQYAADRIEPGDELGDADRALWVRWRDHFAGGPFAPPEPPAEPAPSPALALVAEES